MNRWKNRTTTKAPARFAAGLATVLSAGLLAGCATELPVPVPDAASTGPVLTVEQEAEVVTAVSTVLEQAGAENNADALTPRLAGPALEVRSSQLKVAAALGDAKYVTPLPAQMVQIVVPVTETWPRTTYGVSKQEGTQAPALMVMEQGAARDLYKLWAWVRLVPGVTLPQFATPDAGSEPLAADDTSLLVTPADAVARYAAVLPSGNTSEFAPTFKGDPFRELITKNVTDQNAVENFQAAGGSYTYSFTPRKDTPPRAVRTADGGALVIGVLDSVSTVTVEEGGKAPANDSFPTQKALFGSQETTNIMRTTYLDTVALYVPPAGSEEQVELLGYEHVAVAATNK